MKGMPPQLLGNALIPAAISDPNRGLARMLDRIRVYQAWARQKGAADWPAGPAGRLGRSRNELAGNSRPESERRRGASAITAGISGSDCER